MIAEDTARLDILYEHMILIWQVCMCSVFKCQIRCCEYKWL